MKKKVLHNTQLIYLIIIAIFFAGFTSPIQVKSADTSFAKLLYANFGHACIEAPIGAEVYYSVGNQNYNIKALDIYSDKRDAYSNTRVISDNLTQHKFIASAGNCFYDVIYDWNGNSDKIVYIRVTKDGISKELQVILHQAKKVKAKYVAKAAHLSSAFHDTSEFGYILIYLDDQLVTNTDWKMWIETPFGYESNIGYATSIYHKYYRDFISTWEANNEFFDPLRLAATTTGATLWITPSYADTIFVPNGASTIDIFGHSETVTVKVPQQAKAPNIKLALKTLIFNTSAKQEYSIKINTADYTPWKDTKEEMTLYDLIGNVNFLKNNTPLPKISIQFRVKATESKICSQTITYDLPAQTAADSNKIRFRGKLSKNSKDVIELQITDCNSGTKPYEYCLETPTAETKWKAVTVSTYFTIKELSEGSSIYIREAGTSNTTKGISLKLPSTYVSYKVVNGVMVKR